jgi:hypothetical protein
MRPLMLIGIVLIAIGGFLFYQGGSFTTQKKVLEIGDVKVTAPDQHSVPTWAAGIAVLAGVGLIVAGAQRRGHA